MEELNDVYFDPEVDGAVKFVEGTFPAYISALKLVYLKPKDNGSGYMRCDAEDPDAVLMISDYMFKISEEAGTMTADDPETKKKISCEHMVGKEFGPAAYVIPTLNLSGSDEDRWKNGEYINYHERLGIEFPTKKIDGKKVKQLAKVEEDDVFGIPVWITLKPEKDKTDPEKSYMKVFIIKLREGVERLTREKAEEDELPF